MDIEKNTEVHANGWHEWSKFVLKELERLNECYSEIKSKLDRIPCSENIEKIKSVDIQVNWLQKIIWTICVIGIPSLLGLAVAWGGVTTIIDKTSDKIDEFEKNVFRIEKDIGELKIKSYGYRGIPVVTESHEKIS